MFSSAQLRPGGLVVCWTHASMIEGDIRRAIVGASHSDAIALAGRALSYFEGARGHVMSLRASLHDLVDAGSSKPIFLGRHRIALAHAWELADDPAELQQAGAEPGFFALTGRWPRAGALPAGVRIADALETRPLTRLEADLAAVRRGGVSEEAA